MDWPRVVEVFNPAREQRGSGYLLASGLVLTARHVVEGADGAPPVRLRRLEPDADGLPGQVGAWQDARVAWSGGETLDAALLVPADAGAEFRAGLPSVVLGRVEGRAPVPVDALGFPRAVTAAAHTDTLRLRAQVEPLSQVRAGALLLQEISPRPGEAGSWCGMSGAAVFAGDRLVGVVEAVPAVFDGTALHAAPAHRLAESAGARALLTAAGVEPAAASVNAAHVASLPRDGQWETLRADYTRAVVTAFCRLDRVGFAVGDEGDERLPALRAFAAQRLVPAGGGSRLTLRAEQLAAEARAVVLGGGGAGKSTVLKQTLARAATALPSLVPVWIPVAQLPREGPLTPARLVEFLVGQAQSQLGLAEVRREFFESLFVGGQACLGCDALDEAGSLPRTKEVRNLIGELAAKWPKCRVLVTSRHEAFRQTPLPAAGAGAPRAGAGFVRFDLQAFGRDDVAPFLAGAFPDGAALAKTILMRTGIEALLETPLTLTLVGLVARTNAGLPATRTDLFRSCLDTVCATWDEAKGAAPADGLRPAQRLDVLRWLAWDAQCSGAETLDEPAARAAIAKSAEIATPALAKEALDGLGRRSLVLRPELAPGGLVELRSLGFAHPQFREYLAGAHLAARCELASGWVRTEMAARWLDPRWLDVLRFAVATLNPQPKLRDAVLHAVLDADDPYRDLLHRPELVAAQLLHRLGAADPAVVRRVVGCLEQLILSEPALREVAADAMVRLEQHAAARPAIGRIARGLDLGAALAQGERDPGSVHAAVFRLRLRAVLALGQIGPHAEALDLLAALPATGFAAQLELCTARLRLGDRNAALAGMKALFEATVHDPERAAVAQAADENWAAAPFNDWLTARCADRARLDPGLARLARVRGLLRDDAPQWGWLFERAAEQLRQLPPDVYHAPETVSAPVYAALEIFDRRPPPAARALLEAALRHPSMVWFVAPRIGAVFPELAAEAVAAMERYVLAGDGDWSRINGAIHGIAQVVDDEAAVPALLALVRHLPRFQRRVNLAPALESLARRGRAAEAVAQLRPFIELPAGVHDGAPDDRGEDRRRTLGWAERAFPAETHELLDQLYRGGADPAADARRVMSVWRAAGFDAVARGWFESIATSEDGRLFLQTLRSHGPDTAFTDWARHALGGHVFASGYDEFSHTPDELEHDLATLVERGVCDDDGVWKPAAPWEVAAQLARIAKAVGPERAIELGGRWLETAVPLERLSPAGPAEELAKRLEALSLRALTSPDWRDRAAQAARAVSPEARRALIVWLRSAV